MSGVLKEFAITLGSVLIMLSLASGAIYTIKVSAAQKVYQNKPASVGVTARIWQDMSMRDQNMYVEGMLDAFILAYGQTADPELAWAHRYIDSGMIVKPVIEKIRVYLNQHPEKEYIIMTMVLREVLREWDDVE